MTREMSAAVAHASQNERLSTSACKSQQSSGADSPAVEEVPLSEGSKAGGTSGSGSLNVSMLAASEAKGEVGPSQREGSEGAAGAGGSVEQQQAAKMEVDNEPFNPRRRLKELANQFRIQTQLPSILKKRKKPCWETSEIRIKQPPKWENLKKSRRDLRASFSLGGGSGVGSVVLNNGGAGASGTAGSAKSGRERGPRQYVQKVIQARNVSSPGVSKYMNKFYTSKYRGVHQTFPTRRWEAQFRKSGKPTSLGCFNTEEEAARAYDTMMIWCMIHQPESARPDKTITNFSISDYDFKIPELTQMTQEDLVLALRRLGRKQASENNANGGSKRGSAMLHPLHDNAEEARIREDLGLGNKDPTCKQMYDRISERAPDFLPEKAKGGKYVLGTLKMQRTTLVKAYLKWLDARAQEEKQKAKKQQRKASSGGKKAAAAAATKKQEPAETAEPAAETDEETEVEEDEDDQPADQRLSLLSAVIGD